MEEKRKLEDFSEQIKKFNLLYKLPVNDSPKLLGVERLKNFKSILQEELNEVDDIIERLENKDDLSQGEEIDVLTDISDWLCDMIVYITSEATKHGIDINDTLDIIMQSNFSKLDENGKPIYDERGKVMKGPNYWRPEPKIKEMIKNKLEE